MDPLAQQFKEAAAGEDTWQHGGTGETVNRKVDVDVRYLRLNDLARKHGLYWCFLGIIDAYDAIHMREYEATSNDLLFHSDLWPTATRCWRVSCTNGRLHCIGGRTTFSEEETDKILHKCLSRLLSKCLTYAENTPK